MPPCVRAQVKLKAVQHRDALKVKHPFIATSVSHRTVQFTIYGSYT